MLFVDILLNYFKKSSLLKEECVATDFHLPSYTFHACSSATFHIYNRNNRVRRLVDDSGTFNGRC